MASHLSLVLELQRADARLLELRGEIDQLPKHVTAIQAKLRSELQAVEERKQSLSENEKERRRLETAVQTHQQKIERLQAQMLEVKTNEQYRAFQNEIGFERKEIEKSEDRILDKMEEAEALHEHVDSAENFLARKSRAIEVEVGEAEERVAKDRQELERLQGERRKIAEKVSREWLSTYERVRQRNHGQAVAQLVNDRCSFCSMVQRPAVRQLLRTTDQLIACEFCGCILYIEDPSAAPLEDPAGEAGAS